jgi:hypothetical protein
MGIRMTELTKEMVQKRILKTRRKRIKLDNSNSMIKC